MTARDLLGELRGRGIEVAIRGGRLMLRDPRGELTADLRVCVARHHAGLVEVLTGRSYPCTACARFRFPAPDTVCYWCRRKGGAR